MSNSPRIQQLKEIVSRGYLEEKSAYEREKSYTQSAFRSGGDTEAHYKSLRRESQQRGEVVRRQIEEAEQELVRFGIYTRMTGNDGRVEFVTD
jgi:hypothetical protein